MATQFKLINFWHYPSSTARDHWLEPDERLDDPMRTAASRLCRAVRLADSCPPTAGNCW